MKPPQNPRWRILCKFGGPLSAAQR